MSGSAVNLNRLEGLPESLATRPKLRLWARERGRGRSTVRSKRCWSLIVRFAILAGASVTMYTLFFGSIDRLSPVLTSGTPVGAGSVIGLALCFSLVYGCCAGCFLELLGLRELK